MSAIFSVAACQRHLRLAAFSGEEKFYAKVSGLRASVSQEIVQTAHSAQIHAHHPEVGVKLAEDLLMLFESLLILQVARHEEYSALQLEMEGCD